MNLDEKIELANKICDNQLLLYGKKKFNLLYPFATENILGYLNLFDMSNKNLLTVGSSADQVLNAMLVGTSEISVLDVCPFAREYFYLKKAAIKTLNREEYLHFFHDYWQLFNNKKTFNFDVYTLVRDILGDEDKEALMFWDSLFMKYPNENIIKRNLFRKDEYSIKVLKQINLYLMNDEYYNVLRNRIDMVDVDFQIGDIFNYVSNRQYDNIWLSNIAAYYKLSEVVKLIERILTNLTIDGKILISYLYDTDMEESYYNSDEDIYDIFRSLEVLPKGTKLESFIGVNGYRINDARIQDSVFTYKKKMSNMLEKN